MSATNEPLTAHRCVLQSGNAAANSPESLKSEYIWVENAAAAVQASRASALDDTGEVHKTNGQTLAGTDDQATLYAESVTNVAIREAINKPFDTDLGGHRPLHPIIFRPTQKAKLTVTLALQIEGNSEKGLESLCEDKCGLEKTRFPYEDTVELFPRVDIVTELEETKFEPSPEDIRMAFAKPITFALRSLCEGTCSWYRGTQRDFERFLDWHFPADGIDHGACDRAPDIYSEASLKTRVAEKFSGPLSREFKRRIIPTVSLERCYF